MSSYYTIQRVPGAISMVPTSTAILQDMVVSSRDLDQMERTLERDPSAEAIQDITSKLEHVVKIYNENIDKINWKCDNFQREFKFWQYPTFEFYCAYNRDSQTDPNALKTYENKKTTAAQAHRDQLNEICQLSTIGILHDSLKLKIEKVIQRCMVHKLDTQRLPKLTALWTKVYEYTVFTPNLRQLHEGELTPRGTSNSSNSTTTTTTTNATPSTLTVTTASSTSTPEAVQPIEKQKIEEMATPQPAPAPTSVTANIFMNLDLYNGDSIGICHEPTWGEEPVAFARGTTHGTWQGEIPIDKEFKFVIVQSNGTVLKWENLPSNRRVETGSPFEIQFPNNGANFS